jgi:hypothetical protein
MITAQGDTAKSNREPAAEPQTARSARHADPGPGLAPWPHQQAATIGISGNAPRHAAQSALAQSEAHTPAVRCGIGKSMLVRNCAPEQLRPPEWCTYRPW